MVNKHAQHKHHRIRNNNGKQKQTMMQNISPTSHTNFIKNIISTSKNLTICKLYYYK